MVLDRQLKIGQSPSWANTVVWNPGPALCAQLADMPSDGWRQMLCVEAAQVFDPITVPPGECWEGWQHLELSIP
jgi:glucose-6-phosphate 1-epimerase